MKEAEIKIFGKVQGVGLRAFVKRAAEEHEVRGYVENQTDGAVEILAQGEKEDLERFFESVKDGPFFADVTDMDVSWHEQPSDTYTDFQILI